MDAKTNSKLQEANAAYSCGDFRRALQLYELMASQGFPHGLLMAARMRIDGRGENVDLKKADDLLCQAEALGVPGANAQRAAWALAAGDDQRFFSEIRKEAQRGTLSAQYQVAEAYLHGVGVLRDPIKGRRLLVEASKKGHLGAKILLAKGYLKKPWLIHGFLFGLVLLVYAVGLSLFLALTNPEDERL
jgi:TPR repeat protein